jgi:mRNA-degrading endonuclease RelE of RelBE toxin-antitoxin system
VYEIRYSEGVADDLASLPASQRARILDWIEVQLKHEPNRPTRNRKILLGLVPPWQHADPIWELRIGEYRVFYDVDEAESAVVIRAIRRKPPHKATEEIL